MNKYNEIFKLKTMLENAKIPFEFEVLGEEGVYGLGFRYHLCYPHGFPDCTCSVIEGKGTYGEEVDKLEIMGLLTPDELECDEVVGYLTADDVFDRIKRHWEENKNGK